MNKCVKDVIVFLSGVTVGFVVCGKLIMKSEHIRYGITKEISDKISKWLYGEETGSAAKRVGYGYTDILFESIVEADRVLVQMDINVDRYGFVTVADMYDMAGLSAPYTTANYGWTSVKNAKVIHTRNGYKIDLPCPVKLS